MAFLLFTVMALHSNCLTHWTVAKEQNQQCTFSVCASESPSKHTYTGFYKH